MPRFYDKLGFQMWLQNPAFMRLPREYRGCWIDLRMMAGPDEGEWGYIPIGLVKKATIDNVVDFLCMGEEASDTHYKKIVICPFIFQRRLRLGYTQLSRVSRGFEAMGLVGVADKFGRRDLREKVWGKL